MVDMVDKEFQLKNCKDCYFADASKVGTGEPCCTYPGKLIINPKTDQCESKRKGNPRA